MDERLTELDARITMAITALHDTVTYLSERVERSELRSQLDSNLTSLQFHASKLEWKIRLADDEAAVLKAEDARLRLKAEIRQLESDILQLELSGTSRCTAKLDVNSNLTNWLSDLSSNPMTCPDKPNLVKHETRRVLAKGLAPQSTSMGIVEETRRSGQGGKWMIVIFILIQFFIQGAHATFTPSSSISVLAVNTCGLGTLNSVKLESVQKIIREHKPSVWVAGETKSSSETANRLQVGDEYVTFENPGVVTPSPQWKQVKAKWGISMGIQKDFHIQLDLTGKLKEDPDLKGRVCAVDIIIPTGQGGKGFPHRIIGCYAPYADDGGRATRFWAAIRRLCNDAKHGWTIAGDLNVTISDRELRDPSNVGVRNIYLKFLSDTRGFDLWSPNEDRSISSDWTRGNWSTPLVESRGTSIIDRVVSSSSNAEIKTLPGRISGSDHRAVLAKIIPADLLGGDRGGDVQIPTTETTRFRPPPRLLFPPKTEKKTFDEYRTRVVEDMAETDWGPSDIESVEDFERIREHLSRVVVDRAGDIFGFKKPWKRSTIAVASPTTRLLTSKGRVIGGAINLAKNDEARVSIRAQTLYYEVMEKSLLSGESSLSVLEELKLARRVNSKELFNERKQLLTAKMKKADLSRIATALRGGTTKRLFQDASYQDLPLALNRLSGEDSIDFDEGEIDTQAEQVKETTKRYWANLYQPVEVPEMSKPWMDTISVQSIRERTRQDPFVWPQTMALEDLRAMLRKGNARPSPGPDRWEKWVVKNLPDEALEYVRSMLNWIITNNEFPGDIKHSWLAMMYKKGITTSLANWRGLMLSNFLSNMPLAWMNQLVTIYVTRLGIIPETQIANHKGIQARDMTSFLSAVKCWAHRNHTQIFALKRDQMKGFDFLSPTGFHDAIQAFGLPEEVAQLDIAAQENNTVLARTAYGIADPFQVSGLTKIGGNLSPLKYILTASLANWWIKDLYRELDGELVFRTTSSLAGKEHSPDDESKVLVRLLEAMDDNIILAKDERTLKAIARAHETFQLAYGGQTQWPKSSLTVFSPNSDCPDSIIIPSVSPNDKNDPLRETLHEMAVAKNSIEFLRTAIDDPDAQAKDLSSLVQSFAFPKFTFRPPISLIRKILAQNLFARIRARLTLQPVTRQQAVKLDSEIGLKIHNLLGFPYRANPNILRLPVTEGGLGFPSVEWLNDIIATQGLARDLNHFIEPFRNLARITLADWTCQIGGCHWPLSGSGLEKGYDRKTYYRKIPASMILAQRVLKECKLEIRRTDLSFEAEGQCSVEHFAKKHGINGITGAMIGSMRTNGIVMIADLGKWDPGDDMERPEWQFIKELTVKRTRGKISARGKEIILTTANLISTLSVFDATQGKTELWLTRDERRRRAEAIIVAHALTRRYTDTRKGTPEPGQGQPGQREER